MDLNRVQLVGYVGNHLTTTKAVNGNKRVGIRVATHHLRKNDQGEKTRLTVWHEIVAWDSQADYAEKNFVKGSRILVDGELHYGVYPDHKGHTRYLTQIRAVHLLNPDR